MKFSDGWRVVILLFLVLALTGFGACGIFDVVFMVQENLTDRWSVYYTAFFLLLLSMIAALGYLIAEIHRQTQARSLDSSAPGTGKTLLFLTSALVFVGAGFVACVMLFFKGLFEHMQNVALPVALLMLLAAAAYYACLRLLAGKNDPLVKKTD